jgi:hypothetical protein
MSYGPEITEVQYDYNASEGIFRAPAPDIVNGIIYVAPAVF